MFRSTLLLGCLLFASINSEGAEPKTDLDQIQGGWQGTKLEIGGKSPPAEVVERGKYVFKGNAITMFEGDKIVGKVTFTLDPAKAPKAIDITATEDPQKGKTMLGIYRLEGDTLILCFGTEQRPTEFSASAEKKTGIMEFRRAKSE